MAVGGHASKADASLVAVGAAVGGAARHWCARTHPGPWTVAAINVAGSAVLGALAGCSPLPPAARLLLGTGLCGGFTTFSTYSVDVVRMLEAGRLGHAVLYVCANNAGGVLAAAGGLYAGKAAAKTQLVSRLCGK